MKRYILLLLLIFSFNNVKSDSLDMKLKPIRYTCLFISGFSDGVNDAISFHYSSFKHVHQNINDQFWNPNLSWRNKYKLGSTTKEKFPLSSTILVFTTDGFHLTNMLNRTFLVGGSIIIPLKRKEWWWYLRELGIDYLINRVGFFVSYNIIYK
jgi:hypothetical protein